MDLDNITDIEALRNIAKSYMVQMKRDTEANDGTDYIFFTAKNDMMKYIKDNEGKVGE